MTKERPTTGRFHDLGIEEKLLTALTKKGFETPTPIQHQVITGALEGKDVMQYDCALIWPCQVICLGPWTYGPTACLAHD